MKFDAILMTTVEKILSSNHVPMLLGEPGIGKSSWVEALGHRMHTKVFVLACNQLSDKADMTGARLTPVGEVIKQNDDGTTTKEMNYAQQFFPHIVIQKAIQYAKDHPTETPILFMDELNRTTPDVTSEALSLPTLRSIGDTPLPDNLRIITAGNDKGNITALDDASRTRFVLLHVKPDLDTFVSVNAELNPFVKNVLLRHPESLFGRGLPAALTGATAKNDDDDDDTEFNIEDIIGDEEDMTQLTTPRTITSVSDWLNTCDNDELKQFLATTTLDGDGNPITVLQEILEGHTGQTAFTALLLQEITAGINTINNQSSIFKVPKPNVYDAMATQATHDALQSFIDNMNDKDKSGCLVYAMSEKKDNSDIITTLTKSMTALDKTDIQVFANMFSQDMIQDVNKNAFFNTGTQLSISWSGIFG